MDKPMDMFNQTLLYLKDVSKCFHTPSSGIDIFKNADFSVFKGETVAVTGASGIGKSTLLNLIGTVDKPDSGNIFFNGTDLTLYDSIKLAAFRNFKIGFVFQFHYLLRGFSALENVMIPGLIAGETKKKIEYKAANILKRVGLGDRLRNRVEDLSGGEQQRVALARALVMGPEILLADEPTGNLDKKNSNSVHVLISELNAELGMTVIVVTHNNELAGMMRRRVTILDGKIVPA
jgi:lipoprotein-releasing system ATP-binding protein